VGQGGAKRSAVVAAHRVVGAASNGRGGVVG
jgi:hypothetical protein